MILLVVQPQCLQALLSEEMVPVGAVTIRYRFGRERGVFFGGEGGGKTVCVLKSISD